MQIKNALLMAILLKGPSNPLTATSRPNIVNKLNCRERARITNMSRKLLLDLEGKLDELIGLCTSLEKENTKLKAREETWQQERTRLVEKNEIARSRVEAMIARLKSIGQES